jgi:valyl-tRNA synthetase
MIDPQAERHRLEKQKQKLQRAKKAQEAKLANENFLQKAKPQVVAQAKDRLSQLSKKLKTVEKHLAELENSR